jgi:hypothetical protein
MLKGVLLFPEGHYPLEELFGTWATWATDVSGGRGRA